MSRISLCVICGQEETHVERFLNSFAPAFDGLCLVRAIGNQPHDRTVAMAKAWCDKNDKDFLFGEYRNFGWTAALGYDAPVDDSNPATWKHVDDFSAARNQSFDLATGDWQLWGDMDDVLSPGSAEHIRLCAETVGIDLFYFRYNIRTSQEHNMRERMFRRGIGRWSQPVHENCRIQNPKNHKASFEQKVVYSHEPNADKKRDYMRNRRICGWHMRYLDAFPYEIHRENFYEWQHNQSDEAAEKATYWAEVTLASNALAEQRVGVFLNMAQIAAGKKHYDHAIDLCWSALRLAPWMRDPWGWLAEFELQDGKYKRALIMSEIMSKFKRPSESGFPTSDLFYGWHGLDLHLRTMRAAGNEKRAKELEQEMWKNNGCKFSLLHATRGRPEEALKTRSIFIGSAVWPLAIEHIFAIDADDKESLEKLKHYRHVVVENPRGCVKAWNAAAAASQGDVLVQLSDDWNPCWQWDEMMWLALEVEAKKRVGPETPIPGPPGNWTPIQLIPLVLAIDDGHRKDQLLCMAILTRSRYTNQGYLFHPDYFGVFSDNEFTLRAYDDGVIVQAPHIKFDHMHPIYKGKPFADWDETHRRQNAPERYREGVEIFNRRNPKYAIKQFTTLL